MIRTRSIFSLSLALLLMIVTVGCNPSKDKIRKFDSFYTTGQYDKALAFAQNNISKNHSGKGDDLLWCLNTGVLYRIKQQPQESNKYFDYAEEIYNKHRAGRNEAGEAVAGSLVNDNLVVYTGKSYDGIMINVYKSLNFMQLGNFDYARVELNRALDRQRMALEYYNKEVASLNDEVRKKDAENMRKGGSATNTSQYDSVINQKYPALATYEVYSDFVNPMANYLAGLYFYIDGDYNKSETYLKESVGMNADNEFIVSDYERVNKLLSGEPIEQGGHVWVIYENGLGPERKELLAGLPIPMQNGVPMFVEIALPMLESRWGGTGPISVKAGDTTVQSKQIASMERVIQTDFKKEFKAALTRAIIAATAKAALQYAVRDQDIWVQLGVLAVTVVSTSADVRIWSTLPREFQVARVPMPADGKVNIAVPGNSRQIELPACKNAIIYIKLANAGGTAVYDVIPFK